MRSKVEAYVEQENLHLYCRNEAWSHKLQLSHVNIYRNESERCLLLCLVFQVIIYTELELLSPS